MKNYNYKPITLTALILISSCAKEDDIQYITETITETEYITVTETQVVEIPVHDSYSNSNSRNSLFL